MRINKINKKLSKVYCFTTIKANKVRRYYTEVYVIVPEFHTIIYFHHRTLLFKSKKRYRRETVFLLFFPQFFYYFKNLILPKRYYKKIFHF